MPQIRRIRIVNISYNNGKRLIPDELFDLTDENGSAGLNTLISLINGGGKSVLVQLMMQPYLSAILRLVGSPSVFPSHIFANCIKLSL